jgi:carbonic anhydrase
MRLHRWLVAVAGLGLLCATIVVGQDHNVEHDWDYSGSHGPSHWGDLKPEFAACREGHRQSPIDIRSPQRADLPAIGFDYNPPLYTSSTMATRS